MMNHKPTNDQNATLLVVDDTPENLRLLVEILRAQGYTVRPASNGPRALRLAQTIPVDLILLDIIMPDMDGYAVCAALKQESRTREIPVIFLSGLGDGINKVKGFEAGGVDYITKPFQVAEVLARVQTHLTIRRLQQQLQAENRRFQALAEAAFEGIIIAEQGGIRDVNPQFEQISGYARADVIGRSWLELITPAARDVVAAQLRDGAEQPFEIQGVRRDGSAILLEMRVKNIVAQGESLSIVALRDLSQEKALEAANDQLQQENRTLKTTLKERYRLGDLIGHSPAMQQVYEMIIKAAATEASVLISGESGVGKDLIAQTIHNLSARRDKPFIPVNCGSIPETLCESEFFGHRKGAFTGAVRDQPGVFAAAHQGTLFLDEIGELPLAMQVKLLRAIEGKGYTPVGAAVAHIADARIIAATNQNLRELVRQGKMRADFFYRINVIPVAAPPLRERRADLPLLIEHILQQLAPERPAATLPGNVLAAFYAYHWPGNIRQLQNVLQRYLTLGSLDFGDDQSDVAAAAHARQFPSPATPALQDALDAAEKQVLLTTLQQYQGQRVNTAAALQIDVKTLYRKLKKHGITRN